MVSSLFGAYEYIHYKHSDVGFYGDTNFRLFRVTVHKELQAVLRRGCGV